MECISCKQNKPKKHFTLRQKKCRECRSREGKIWYQNNRELYLKKIAEKTKILKDHVLSVLNDNVCTDCGCDDIRVLEFDHVNDDKKNDINVLINRCVSLETLKTEIAKCEIVCGNCHRIRTDERMGGSYRSIPTAELIAVKQTRSASKRTKLKKQFRILEIMKTGCHDCKTQDLRVLEFDHVRGEKIKNVSRLLSDNVAWIKIQEEIDKCDVVCRNCHTIRERNKDTKTYRL